MKFEVCDRLQETFLVFLDIAQAQYESGDIEKFTDEEREVYNLVRSWIDRPSRLSDKPHIFPIASSFCGVFDNIRISDR